MRNRLCTFLLQQRNFAKPYWPLAFRGALNKKRPEGQNWENKPPRRTTWAITTPLTFFKPESSDFLALKKHVVDISCKKKNFRIDFQDRYQGSSLEVRMRVAIGTDVLVVQPGYQYYTSSEQVPNLFLTITFSSYIDFCSFFNLKVMYLFKEV